MNKLLRNGIILAMVSVCVFSAKAVPEKAEEFDALSYEKQLQEFAQGAEDPVYQFEVSMYCSNSVTASGVQPSPETIAAPKEIPFGENIYLDVEIFEDHPEINDMVYTVEDRGESLERYVDSNGIMTYPIRIYTRDKNLANSFGTRIVYGHIY